MSKPAQLAARSLVSLLWLGHASIYAACPSTFDSYSIDPNASSINFDFTYLGFNNQNNRFDKSSGALCLNPRERSASVEVDIDARSINTGFSPLNSLIQSADFFDAENYPKISFKSTKVSFIDDSPNSIEGYLNIKGIEKPVTLKVSQFQKLLPDSNRKETISAIATTTIKRADFRMNKYASMVGDDITLAITIMANKD